MERNRQTPGIILTVRDFGENNRIASILTPEEGIISAVIYGGPKSRLRSLVQPYNSGIVYLYEDSVKKNIKLSDFDAKKTHLSLRENIFKVMAASFASEIVIKTKGAGDFSSSFRLLDAFLDGCDAVSETEAKLGLIRFLWRYLGILGVQCNLSGCISCGSSLIEKNKKFRYIQESNGFLCNDCSPYSQNNGDFITDTYALTYLAAINELSPGQVRSLLLPEESVYSLKQLLYWLIEKECGTKLDSLIAGSGIL